MSEEQGLDREWLYSWIRNSSGLIKSGDAYANKVYNEYNKTAMTAFPTLSDEDLNNILAYTAAVPEKKEAAVVAVASGAGAGNDDSSNQILLAALAVLFALLAVAVDSATSYIDL